MRKHALLLFTTIVLICISCGTVIKHVGTINMISTRNINPDGKYKLLSTYMGSSKKDKEESRATSINQAVDDIVKKVPGGDYLMNCKIYLVNNRYWAIEGDVWGTGEGNTGPSFRGFAVNDTVTWKDNGSSYATGTVIAIKDNICLVKPLNGNQTIEVKYENLTKVKSVKFI